MNFPLEIRHSHMNDVALEHHIPQHLRNLDAYQAGRSAGSVVRELGVSPERIVKLASNENPLGMSPKAAATLAQSTNLALYPDTENLELIDAISRKFQVTASQVIVGSGSSEIIDIVSRLLLTQESSAIYDQSSFIAYRQAITKCGARHIKVPSKAFGHDLLT
jgi:histidinol-phosphate aminotransferase